MTQLVIIRHGDAGDQATFAETGEPDHRRPLSRKGRKQIGAAVEGLLALVPSCELVATSPFTRAVQTARIVARAYAGVDQETTDVLQPGTAPEDFVAWFNSHPDADTVIVVGHQPDLGRLATWLLTGTNDTRIEFKKGGACLLVFEGRIMRGAGHLHWLMGPKQLAAVALG
jgi:phosphohistidine phosphatase